MRVVNADGRLGLLVGDVVIDVESASGGEFSAEIQAVYTRWQEFRDWAGRARSVEGTPLTDVRLGPVTPTPRQIFAIGLNYREHAVEAGLDLPESPMVFTKFPTSVAGPFDSIMLPPGSVDFEAELVVVIGQRARQVLRADAWNYVAGLTAGQDLSERDLQVRPPAPQQFSLAKSFPGFAPIGPVLVTPEEFGNPDDLEISCEVNGEQLQKARTADLIFDVTALIEFLSSVLPLLPGDLIFTGTPSGVGFAMTPQRFLRPGDEVLTRIEGIGVMRNQFVERTTLRSTPCPT